MANVETLLYIIKDGRVLLIEKKRGLGKGLYNGVGGKVEQGETPIQAAIRECKEEIGVEPINVTWRGVIEFINDGSVYSYVHVFIADDYKGEIRETDEAKPEWFPINKIPYNRMWEDDRTWLPVILKEKKMIYASFEFVDDWRRIINSSIYELKKIK